jgi:hypothetical protein
VELLDGLPMEFLYISVTFQEGNRNLRRQIVGDLDGSNDLTKKIRQSVFIVFIELAGQKVRCEGSWRLL